AALTTPALAGHPVSVLAPRELSATRIIDVIAAAGGHELRLAVGAHGPGGWSIPGSIPIAMTVDGIAPPFGGAAGRGAPTGKPAAGVRLVLDSAPEGAIKAAKAADHGALT